VTQRIGNWPLLIQTVEHIIFNPNTYDQTVWSRWSRQRGTSRCLAGWLAHLDGWREIVSNDVPGDTTWAFRVTKQGVFLDIPAAALLALDVDPARYGYVLDQVDQFGDWDEDRACPELVDLASLLFGGAYGFADVLDTVSWLAYKDGVTLSPVIVSTMFENGVEIYA
jgi:hypothetical protein